MAGPPPNEQRVLQTWMLLAVGALAIGVMLYLTASVTMPLTFALFLGFLFVPVVDTLALRWRLPRWAAVLGAFGLASLAVLAVVALLGGSLGGIADKASFYKERLAVLAQGLTEWLAGFGIDVGDLASDVQELPLFEVAQSAVGSAAGVLGNLFLVLLLLAYFVSGRVPGTQARGTLGEVEAMVRRYTATKFMTSAVTGVLVWLLLVAFGIDLAVFFGVATFLLNFIPTVGSLAATLLPLPIALVQHGLPTMAAVAVALIVVQNVVGNVVEPRLMGEGLGLHPVTILVGLGIWGLVWGPGGMLLSAPLSGVLRRVLERFETTRPLADLMAGRRAAEPEPEPAQGFEPT